MTITDRIAAAKRARTSTEDGEGDESLSLSQVRRRRSSDPFADLKRTVHQRLLDTLGPKLYDAHMTQSELETKVRQTLQETLATEQAPLTVADRTRIAQEIADDILGYGPIEPFLRDPEITEVMVNGPHAIFIEREGRISAVEGGFVDDAHVKRTIDKIVGRIGRRVDEAS